MKHSNGEDENDEDTKNHSKEDVVTTTEKEAVLEEMNEKYEEVENEEKDLDRREQEMDVDDHIFKFRNVVTMVTL